MSLQVKLPVFKLPFLAFHAIVKQMDIKSLFVLIFCSKKTASLVKKCRIKLKFFEFFTLCEPCKLRVCTLADMLMIDSQLHYLPDSSLFINFTNYSPFSNDFELKSYKINGKEIRISLPHRTLRENAWSWNKSPVEGLKVLADYLLDIFPASNLTHMRIKYETIDLLYKYGVSDTLELYGDPPVDFTFESPLKFKTKLYIECASWLTGEQLLSIDAPQIHLYPYGCQNLQNKDINEYIKKWVASDDKTLECFKCRVELEMSSVLEGLATKPWDPEKRSGCWNTSITESITCNDSMCFDVQREDGLLATIKYHSSYFHLLVWHNPFPTVFPKFIGPSVKDV